MCSHTCAGTHGRPRVPPEREELGSYGSIYAAWWACVFTGRSCRFTWSSPTYPQEIGLPLRFLAPHADRIFIPWSPDDPRRMNSVRTVSCPAPDMHNCLATGKEVSEASPSMDAANVTSCYWTCLACAELNRYSRSLSKGFGLLRLL